MSWRERLLPASFRGQSFRVLSDTLQGGRRVVTHEYPYRDTPYAEDLGRSARTYQVQAVLLGPLYDLALRGLTLALEQPGPGLLVHPSYGLRQVMCVSYQVELSTAEGGMARVNLEFGEAGEKLFPSALLDRLLAVYDQAATLWGYTQTALAAGWWAAGLVQTLSPAAGRLIGSVLTAVDIGGVLGLPATVAATPARALADARADLPGLQAAPDRLAAATAGHLARIVPAATAAWPGYLACRAVAVMSDPPAARGLASAGPALLGPVRTAAAVAAVRLALQAVADGADARAVVAAARPVPVAAQDIRALQVELTALLDARQEDPTTTDQMFAALAALRQLAAADLAARALRAPRRVSVTLPATLPAVVVAYRLHGDASRADEIVRRNRVRHPGCVPGGVPIEVLR